MYMCATARVSILHFSTIFRLDFGTVPTVWHCYPLANEVAKRYSNATVRPSVTSL